MGVACQGRVPGRQLLSQVGRGAGKRERKTLDERFEVNFKAGSGFNPSARRCPDMGLPVFLCWKWRGNPGLSNPGKKRLFSFQPQGRSSHFAQLHGIGLLRRGKIWIQCSLQPRRFKAASHFSRETNSAVTATAEPQPLRQGATGSWVHLLAQRNFKSSCF